MSFTICIRTACGRSTKLTQLVLCLQGTGHLAVPSLPPSLPRGGRRSSSGWWFTIVGSMCGVQFTGTTQHLQGPLHLPPKRRCQVELFSLSGAV